MSVDIRVGVDVLQLERFRRIARHPRFRTLIFTSEELAQAPDRSAQRFEEYLAGRFAAKEAVAKVLGTGLMCGVGWRDIEVTRDGNGAPAVTLHSGARRAAHSHGLGNVSVSITHQGPMVVCVAAAGATP